MGTDGYGRESLTERGLDPEPDSPEYDADTALILDSAEGRVTLAGWAEREATVDQDESDVAHEHRAEYDKDEQSAAFDSGLQIGASTEHNVARRAIAGAVLGILGKDRADGPIDLGALGWWLAGDDVGAATETYPMDDAQDPAGLYRDAQCGLYGNDKCIWGGAEGRKLSCRCGAPITWTSY